MSLEQKINEDIKKSMKSKNAVALESLRAIKSALLLLKSNGSNKEINEQEELSVLQKLVKQRRESATLYEKQDRKDLAETEFQQLKIIESYLPQQLDEEEVKNIIGDIIDKAQATSIKDMGKVMKLASEHLKGQADGRLIAELVKKQLSNS